MPFPIDRKLVIGVSSSALFRMEEANKIFLDNKVEAYRQHQRDNVDVPFEKGVAFPFIKRLLNLNNIYPDDSPIEVVVLSRNDPDSGRRFFRSCNHYELKIERGAFLAGSSPHPYIESFNCSLFLSSNKNDVKMAVEEGRPAGLVLPSNIQDKDDESQLRVAFDFDGVIVDDEAEKVYKKTKDLDLFHQRETEKKNLPHGPGPLFELVKKISHFQKIELLKREKDPNYKPLIRIAVVTARSAPSNERLVTTLNQWKITPDESFFLGGIEKKRILEVFKPHIFFDDQLEHLEPTASTIPSVHIPFGIANRN